MCTKINMSPEVRVVKKRESREVGNIWNDGGVPDSKFVYITCTSILTLEI